MNCVSMQNQNGQAVIPIQMETLSNRLEKKLQLIGSPVELFSRQLGLENGNSESGPSHDQGY